jgi:superfamily I DNA and/or RNA helicase
LIAFSNKYFYQNKLQVYPSYPFNEHAVKGFYIPDAVYEEGINPIEAKAIARSFTEALKEKDVIGLVAMSEHQLAEILRHIDASAQHLLSNRLEEGSCFFKTLEQVQGDECDRLWISFAYGKNKDGQFHQRFGPINLSTGPKRLNVLFSRAKEQINFYHSIHASEFQLSNNEGTQLLMKFIQGLETDVLASKHFILPEGFHGSIDKQNLGLVLDYTKLKSANYLASNLVTLSKRGWNIKV